MSTTSLATPLVRSRSSREGLFGVLTGRNAAHARLPKSVAFLLIYLGAITIIGKGPTYLGCPPIYWGEVVLVVSLLWVIGHQGTLGLRSRHGRLLSFLILAYMLLGAVLATKSVGAWGLDAARDAAICYYAAFYFVGLNVARRQALGARVWKTLCLFWVLALVWESANLLSGGWLAELGPEIPGRTTNLLSHSGNEVMQHMGLGAVIVLFLRPPDRYRHWRKVFVFVALLGLALLALSHLRGAKGGLLLGAVVVLALGLAKGRPIRFSTRMFWVGAVGGTALLAGSLVTSDLAEAMHLRRFAEANPFSPQGTAYWRMLWWEELAAEVMRRNPAFGLGFGESLGVYNPYLLGNEQEAWPVRSPHNINMTVFARTGIVGGSLWAAMLAIGFGGLFRRVWRGGVRGHAYSPERREELVFWLLMLIATWGNSSVGVLMEGPVLGVWFWFALGFAWGRSLAFPARHEASAVRRPLPAGATRTMVPQAAAS